VWIERLASETGLDPRVLRGAVPGGRPRRRSGQPNEYAQSVVAQTTARSLAADTAADIENALVGLLLHIVVVPAEAARLVRDVEFRDPQNRAIVDALLVWQESGSYEYEAFRESLPETLRSRADALRTPEAPLPEEEKVTVAVAFHLARLRQFRLRSDLRRATETLQTLAPEDQRIAADQIGSLHRAELEIERALDELSRQAVQASTADYGTMDQDSGRL
jgi:hypothetical protein